jgi:hypothetical protein
MKTTTTLYTKTMYMKRLQCPGTLEKFLITEPTFDESQKQIFQNGVEVGILGRELYSDGIDVEDDRNFFDQVRFVKESLRETGTTLFEPPFITNLMFARADHVTVLPDGTLRLREFKSTTNFDEFYNTREIYFQKRVIEESTGLKVSKLELVLIDNEYVYDGKWNPHKYFKIIEVSMAKKMKKEIYKEIDEFIVELKLGFSSYKPGQHCKKPHLCSFYADCTRTIGTILNLRRGAGKSWAFIDEGIFNISDVKDVSKLSAFQLKQYESEKFQKPVVDHLQIKKFLSGISYPCSFLDFEGFSTPIVHDLGFKNVKPYAQNIFQACLKIERFQGSNEIEHYGVVATSDKDPRKQVADFLSDNVPDNGSVVVYFKTYEVTRLRELIVLFPEYENKFLSIIERVVDLEEVFSKGHYVDHRIHGTSIKKVLGILCPELKDAYQSMPLINNGQLANIKYLKYFRGLLSNEEETEIFEALNRYCSLDVLSLVKILKKLRSIDEK